MPELPQNEAPGLEARLELQYLPCLDYFACILFYDHIYIDVEERYVKQTFRNRCSVLTTNKVDILTVPVKIENNGLTRDVRIENGQDWTRRHIGCFQSAYGKSPFYEYYAQELIGVFEKKYDFLVDLNYDLLTICLRLVGIKNRVTYNLSGTKTPQNDVINEISQINNKKSGYNFKYYNLEPYYQTFGNDFVGNLSIVDLIFNMGPEARSVLLRSCKRQ